jgi:hypothetical protein
MSTNFVWAAALLGLCSSAGAWAQICVYKDAEGHITYSNVNEAPPKGSQKLRCLKEASPRVAAPAASKPSPRADAKVDQRTQQWRDNERRRILEQELTDEQQRLNAAREDLAAQEALRRGDERNDQRLDERVQPYRDRVETHERNIQALQQELKNLK